MPNPARRCYQATLGQNARNVRVAAQRRADIMSARLGPARWHRARRARKGGGKGAMATPDRVRYWSRTKSLMFVMLGLWVFFGYVIHFFVDALNNIVILGFPLGFYMAAQGSLIAFVVMLFWFARRQNAIDEEHGVAED
jgi:putative solute:sodium symporter small subunit